MPNLIHANNHRIVPRLLKWFRAHGRTLPWRGQVDPYAVWVSEMMLQQTRVGTVIPYYRRWMKKFPSIQSLAKSSEQEVLRTWEGLGYYRRARDLHKAAKIVKDRFEGKLPSDPQLLAELPGFGRYTVGAVSSIAFGKDLPAVDGNQKRVFARLYDITQAVDSPAGDRLLWSLAGEILPKGKSSEFNQAVMDFGSSICLPRNPNCEICPVRAWCRAYQNGTQFFRPVKKRKGKSPHYHHVACVIEQNGRVLVQRRSERGLLGGMWEFPGGRVSGVSSADVKGVMKNSIGVKITSVAPLGTFRHAYTHFKVTVHAFRCEVDSIPNHNTLKWIRPSRLGKYPMGKVDRLIAQKLTDV
jgi:A/G-specific adenine glycosylase